MEEPQEQKHKQIRRWVAFFAFLFFGAFLYVIISYRLTPSWIIGQEIESSQSAIEITTEHLVIYPNLERFIANITRSNSDSKVSVVFIRASNGQGRRLNKFFRSQVPRVKGEASSITIKYQGKYYGLDLIYQYKRPIIF